MKVKIGNKIYDSNQEIICLILSEQDKENIANMHHKHKFCTFPDDIPMEVVYEFLEF